MGPVLTLPITDALFAISREAPLPHRPPSPVGYEVDPEREYEVRWEQPTGIVGHCRVTQREDRALVVELTDVEISVPLEAVAWRPMFNIEADGVARLQAIAAFSVTP